MARATISDGIAKSPSGSRPIVRRLASAGRTRIAFRRKVSSYDRFSHALQSKIHNSVVIFSERYRRKAMSSAPTSAAAVANEFLALGDRDGIPIDQMKLQKLLYYAHAWHLAMNNKPLFDEDIEAWPWGPVVRDIYNETRSYGRGPITDPVSHLERVGRNALDWRFTKPKPIEDKPTRDFLEEVWKSHKAYSGVQLSNSTHATGEPWTIVKEQYGSLDRKPTIPNSLIADVFKKKLATTVANPAA